jgi:hypothetical protein
MQLAYTYWIENHGNIEGTAGTLALDPTQSYMVEGFLTKKDGGDYAHVYIKEISAQGAIGIYDDGQDIGIVAVLSNATSVTVALHTTGGNHRAEGVVWQL